MSSKRYEPYDYGEPIDEDEGHSGKPRFQPKEDIMSAARGAGATKKSSSRWVFISRKADIGLVLVLLLSTGLGIMWLISQLPVFVETASNHYYWAKDVYATWGTPSMRWLFINLVVGVILATSGLLSAFGGDSSTHETDRSTSGYDKGVDYRGADPGVAYGRGDPAYSNSANQARFSGPGYESPLYNPYVEEPAKERLQHEGSSEAWNHADDRQSEARRGEEGHHRGVRHGSMEEPPPFARPVDPEVLRAARPVSRQGSQRRGVPTPADDGVPMPSRDLPREMFDTPLRGGGGGGDMSRGEVPGESFREVPREMPPMDEPPPPPPREIPTSREVPAPMAPTPVADEEPPPPEPEASEGINDPAGGSRKEDAIEIISKVYDPVPELEDRAPDHEGKFHRLQTDSGIHYSPHVEEALADSSPAKAEALRKSHTFTLGRVIRRDQLVDFIEPLSRKLEGIGRKVSHKSSHSDSGIHQSRELPSPLTSGAGANSLPAAIEAVGNSAPKPEKHKRRLSSEAIPATRRLPSESGSSTVEGNILKQASAPVIPNKFPPIVPASPTSPPLLKQRSIVYPPALLSQACTVVEEELSPPPSPPIEDAIPPPPPPHLKLPPASVASTDELPSFKYLVPPGDSTDLGPAVKSSKKQAEKVSSSEDLKRPPSGKHSRTPSSTVISPASSLAKGAGTGESSSASGLDERSVATKPRKLNAGDEKAQEGKGGPRLDRQDSSSGGKDDDLHQQIEDFLARFHENWRLQRQESLARYKKRLSELDEE